MSLQIDERLVSRAYDGERVEKADAEVGSSIASHAGTSVVVVDSRVLIRECLAKCLEASIGRGSVGTFPSLREWADKSADKPAPALILLCLDGRPGVDDQIEQIEREKAELAGRTTFPPIVFLSEEEDVQEIVNALDSGAKGYIPTSVSLEVAIEALNLVKAGGIFVPASSLLAARRALKTLSSDRKSPLASMFTERQAAVVEAIRLGKANKLIAYELKMHESTVKVHVRNIMKKLNAQNRTQVAYLTQHLFRNVD